MDRRTGLLGGAAAILATAMTVGYSVAAEEQQSNDSGFSTTPNGRTYGKIPAVSDGQILRDEDIPDLVAVVGDHGVEGFVEKSFIDGSNEAPPSTPAAALKQQESVPLTYSVPVYAADGWTIIDSYTIRSHDPNATTDSAND